MAKSENIVVRIDNVKLPINKPFSTLKSKLAGEMRVKPQDILSIRCLRQSVDARRKDRIVYNLSLRVVLAGRNAHGYQLYSEKYADIGDYLRANGIANRQGKAVIVGSGPSGLFAGLTLAKAGYEVTIIERGRSARERKAEVDRFKATLTDLDTECNIQFGEGGAGTFSDGKLNTGVKSELIDIVLREFVAHGAREDILYMAKPHIGTDYLVNIVENMRHSIESLGGKVYFDTKVEDIIVRNGALVGVKTSGAHSMIIDTDIALFAVGHSARDTFEMLLSRGVDMASKPFSIGVRIEHRQADIGASQYGASYTLLPAADYKLSCHLDNGKSLYTFCMCPGGYVVPATSEAGGVVTNGMSENARDGANANSALLVNVDSSDYGEGVLAGVEYQRRYERMAYDISHSFRAPCSRVDDFLSHRTSSAFGEIQPTYNGVTFADMDACLPSQVAETLRAGIPILGEKLRGFDRGDALLTGVETRSSSPVRILRDEHYESNIRGLYPVGEGAGYAGGITSASVDGIKTALAVLDRR